MVQLHKDVILFFIHVTETDVPRIHTVVRIFIDTHARVYFYRACLHKNDVLVATECISASAHKNIVSALIV